VHTVDVGDEERVHRDVESPDAWRPTCGGDHVRFASGERLEVDTDADLKRVVDLAGD
jgi:hypothetical protein